MKQNTRDIFVAVFFLLKNIKHKSQTKNILLRETIMGCIIDMYKRTYTLRNILIQNYITIVLILFSIE